ncbi:hypothetical protein JXR93_08400 [bacterium]|nr:hypothetical protein [bacterium]
MRLIYLLIMMLLSILQSCKNSNMTERVITNKTTVLLLGSIHGAHRENPNYSFEQLFSIIDKFNPDIVGIEIRVEDINESFEYLKKSYPPDMLKIKEKYSKEKVIVGFDWLGETIEGKLIPENYWKESFDIKQLERELNNDSSEIALTIKNGTKLYDSLQLELIKNGNVIELNTKYEEITTKLYDNFRTLTKNSKYQKLSDYYTTRDGHIDENIIQIIKNNIGKRIIFIMGVDHRVFASSKIKKEIGDKIELINIKDIVNR